MFCFSALRCFVLLFSLGLSQLVLADTVIYTDSTRAAGLIPVKPYRHFHGGNSFLSIKGNQFRVLRTDNVRFEDMNLGILGISPAIVDKRTMAYAPVRLPRGSKMKGMIVRMLDKDPVADISVELVKTHWRFDQDFIRYNTYLFIRSKNHGRFNTFTEDFHSPMPFEVSPERWFVVVTFDGASRTPIQSHLRVSWVTIVYDK